MRPYIYLRALRQADHTVFAVADGQKTYHDPRYPRFEQAYSSGQQVKRSILDTLADELGEARAPITFVKVLKGKTLGDGEPWSPCDPTYTDQLLGGWMRAQSRTGDKEGGRVIKRRSPLSISAMRPLHPLLARVEEEKAITFDRRDDAERHPVIVRDAEGRKVSDEEIRVFLDSNNQTLRRLNFVRPQKRAYGLFVHDVAIDLRHLFSVSAAEHDPELDPIMIEKLRAEGWLERDGRLVCPAERREQIIPALAHSLLHWAITSNQARTYSPMHTLAVAVSDRANRLGSAIRADLRDDDDGLSGPAADPMVVEVEGAKVFVTPACRATIAGIQADVNALDYAEAEIGNRLLSFDYERAVLPAAM